MIVNEKHRFVFVHVPKTGGTSISRALRPLDGNVRTVVAKSKHETATAFLARTRPAPFLPSRYWRFTYFAFVRNPWDRFASLHRYLLARHSDKWSVPASVGDLAMLLEEGEDWVMALHSIKPQSAFLSRRTLVGRFESLSADFAEICANLGVVAKLPHLNATEPSDYRRHFDARAAAIVGTRYADDIERFGYTFDPPAPLPLDRQEGRAVTSALGDRP